MHNRVKMMIMGLIITAGCVGFLPARAGWTPYDWLITIELTENPNQLDYKDSSLSPVTEARISYATADGSNSTDYETIWFGNGKAYGIEREEDFSIGDGQGVAIKIVHDGSLPTNADLHAAANAIIRMYLDVHASRNNFQFVIVPDDSFSGIISALGDEHFQVFTPRLEVPYQVSALILIQDESGKQKQTVCYAPTSGGTH